MGVPITAVAVAVPVQAVSVDMQAVKGNKFCPQCGTKLEGGEKFCPSCGGNVL